MTKASLFTIGTPLAGAAAIAQASPEKSNVVFFPVDGIGCADIEYHTAASIRRTLRMETTRFLRLRCTVHPQ